MGRASKVNVGGVQVTAVLDGPTSASDLVFLAPGAGAGIHSEFMSYAADGLANAGLRVCRFNFPYLESGRKTPDRQPVLEETFRAVIDAKSKGHEGRVFVGGKSMGGRISSHIVAAGVEVDGLYFLGYPLHPPGRPEKKRDAHLYGIDHPMLFVEGTRDPFCPLKTLDQVRAKLRRSEMAVIDDGDHSFKVRKSSGRNTTDAWTEVVEAVANWIDKLPSKI
jgi:predicted alpha/beta-hydrolase family hydrolase